MPPLVPSNSSAVDGEDGGAVFGHGGLLRGRRSPAVTSRGRVLQELVAPRSPHATGRVGRPAWGRSQLSRLRPGPPPSWTTASAGDGRRRSQSLRAIHRASPRAPLWRIAVRL